MVSACPTGTTTACLKKTLSLRAPQCSWSTPHVPLGWQFSTRAPESFMAEAREPTGRHTGRKYAETTDSVLIHHQKDDSNFSPSSSLLNQNWQLGDGRLFHPCIHSEPISPLGAFHAAGQAVTSTFSPKPPQNCISLVQHRYPGTWSRESLLT